MYFYSGGIKMDLKLTDKTALVTGSTAGIGLSIAESLAREGATVVINGRTEDRVAQAINSIKNNNSSAKLIPAVADLSTTAGVANIINKIPSADILINNLGFYQIKQFTETTDEEWQNMFNINVMSGVRLSRHYLPQMLKKNWGRIIFISSESGLQIPVEMIHYGMSKTAQLAIARGLAELTIGTNVTVNSILPGPTKSEGVEHFLDTAAKERNVSVEALEKEFFNTIRPTSLIKRFTDSHEIAAMVAFMSSPLSSATNGAAIRVDGGVVKSIV
jgi:NAD(P)-dependent dehydrogenase (short-subunit alcohol dehydrogenase family)